MGVLRLRRAAVLGAFALLWTGCDQLIDGFGKKPEDKVAERVDFILTTIKDLGGSTTDQLQVAICRWYADKYHLTDGSELAYAMDQFEDWQKRAGIYPRLREYEIVEIRPEEESPNVYLVLTKINGGYHWMRVPQNGQIDWADEGEEG
jgi:hypothetical protein